MIGDGNPAVFVGTMLQTGDAVALCDDCLVPWAAALLNAMTGVDPMPFLAAVASDGEDAAPSDPAPASEPSEEIPAPPPPDTDVASNGKPQRVSRARAAATDVSEGGTQADGDAPATPTE